ncbi:MAG: hypothetical protein EA345_16630 [Halomonas sp.]|nr:MAG: hypothetical protein EA345_16630 [Halomonas sp.]
MVCLQQAMITITNRHKLKAGHKSHLCQQHIINFQKHSNQNTQMHQKGKKSLKIPKNEPIS